MKVRAGGFHRPWANASIAGASVAAASLLGQAATYPSLATWYSSLAKPALTPPNWLFAPVWTALYLLIGFALWRVLSLAVNSRGRASAIALFYIQLVLNALWSWMFFALHSPLLGLVDIVPQLAVIFATAVAFYRLDRIAGWCIVPLAAWVSYAVALNASIWSLNR